MPLDSVELCVSSSSVFYPDTLGLGEDVGGLGAVPSAGSRGRAPGQGVWGRSAPEAGSLLLHK